MEFDTGNFANFGFLKAKVPDNILQALQSEIDNINYNTDEKIVEKLAGNIEHQYELTASHKLLEPFVTELAHNYYNQFNFAHSLRLAVFEKLKLYMLWANIQKKHEFNPMHTHDGAFSFVIWLKVPYRAQDEIAQEHVRNSNMKRAGMFSFLYTNVFGEIREAVHAVDETYEGTIFLFPSILPHTVYPFSTSDGVRISVSGNIGINYE